MDIALASIMHDVGKIAIPDAILNKPGRLTPEEFEIMKTHTTQGGELLKKISLMREHEAFRYAYDIAVHHHERYDGKGYPEGLKGDEISLWAQIVSLADVYDALISKRIYKDAFGADEAVQMMKDGKCGVFNPRYLEVFLRDNQDSESFTRRTVHDACHLKLYIRREQMDEILKKQLQDGGIDTNEIMERMMGSEALMKKLLKKFLSDTNFSTLEKALSENDVEEAFRAAHTLKGVAGTLALTGMHSIAAEITELLRNDSILQAKNKFPELADAYDSVIKMIEKLE